MAFLGTERFEVKRRLGVGGMGEVYEVFDKRRQQTLALKVLRRESLRGVSQVKREFRAVAGLRHPHLVNLYDLYVEPERVFFTMELARGQDLRQYILGPLFLPQSSENLVVSEEEDTQLVTEGRSGGVRFGRRSPPIQEEGIAHLLPLLPQLLGALDFLHRSGKVHRDLKPHHVVIDGKGSVKLLDFGLLTRQGHSEEGRIQGTPTYMSPEVISGREVSGAADMYSLGVMLYELFAGRPPFMGDLEAVLHGHQKETPLPLGVVGVHAAWEAPILSLLAKDPAARPSASDFARQLEELFGAPASGFVRRANQEPVFVGRIKERQHLFDTAREVLQGGIRAILITGASGSGKTALAREVAVQLEREGWQYLTSRCFEREAVPFRAIDALLEELASDLVGRRVLPTSALSEEAIGALLQLFPALGQVEALQSASQPRAQEIDPDTYRRMGMRAFGVLLRELSRERPMVLELNDLQWADKDSIELLTALFEAKPTVFLLGTSWEEGITEGGALSSFLAEHQGARLRVLRVGPLSLVELREMAQQAGSDLSSQTLLRIHQEASVTPYWAWELLQSAKTDRSGAMTLGKIIARKVDSSGDTARAALEVVSASGGRTSFALIERISKVKAEELARTLDELVRFRLLREAHGAEGQDGYVSYHERVRIRVYEMLPEERRRALHAALAEGMEALGEAARALGTCAEHWHLAGQEQRAAEVALLAAREARATLALELAASLFLRAAQWAEQEATSAEGEAGAGEVLDKLGRGEEAAAAFFSAADRREGEESARLKVFGIDAALRATDSIEHALRARQLIEDLEAEGAPWSAPLILRAYAAFAQTTSIAFLSRDVDLAERYFEFAELTGDAGHRGMARVIAAYVLGLRGDDGSRRVATRLLEEAAPLLDASEDPIAPAMRGLAWGQLRLTAGEHLAAAGSFGEVVKSLRERGHQTSRFLALAVSGQAKAMLLQGNVKGARSLLEPLVDATIRPELRASHLHIITTLAPLWALLGEVKEAAALLEAVEWSSTPGVRLALLRRFASAEVALFSNRPELAQTQLQPIWDDPISWGLPEQPFERGELSLLTVRAYLAQAARLSVREPADARQLIQQGISVLADPLEANSRRLHGEALYWMGISKAKLSGPEAGLLWLERAVPLLEMYGGPILLASSLQARGVLRRRAHVQGAQDDLVQAQALLAAIGIQEPTSAQGIFLEDDAQEDFGEDEETLVG